jgi:hypothetical protein
MEFSRIIFFFCILTCLTAFHNEDVQSELWERTFDSTYSYGGDAHDLQQTSDGGYMIVTRGPYLVKTDSAGSLEWEKAYGGHSSENRSPAGDGKSVKQTADGGYIVVGSKRTTLPGSDIREYIYILKTDSNGNEEWSKIFAYPELEPKRSAIYYSASSIEYTIDGGYIIVGSYEVGLSDYGAFLIKIDSSGNIQFNESWDELEVDSLACARQSADGGYIITGTHEDDILLLKTDYDGNLEWRQTFGGG